MIDQDDRQLDDAELERLEFANNAEPRVPCILLLDTSGSMSGEPIDALNAGLRAFKAAVTGDPLARMRVELCVVTFGATVELLQEFQTVDTWVPPVLATGGLTPMAEAIELGLGALAERKAAYRRNQVPYYRPWLWIITDGGATDMDRWASAVAHAQAEETRKGVSIFAVGVGDEVDFRKLRVLSTQRDPLQLKGMDFGGYFGWLSDSLSSVSHSQFDEEIPLANPAGWGVVPT